MIQKIRGTQDFLDLTLFNFITQTVSSWLTTAHFTQIATPILEPVALFKRSLGQETDVVSKEMFILEQKSENDTEQICLRPEATAPTVRAFLEHGIQKTPWKVFSYGPMFRYERPQKGRFRQFHQVSIELIGVHSIAYDAQFISILDQFFSRGLLLDNYALAINYLGCAQDREQFKKKLATFLDKHIDTLCDTCRQRKETNILRIFDCKKEACHTLYTTKAPLLIDNLCSTCTQEFATLQEQLALLSVSFSVVPTLVRGLDYYDKTVFEFISPALGAQATFCGGGRYNTLITQLGGKHEQPSLGAAMGIERLMLLLEPIQSKLPLAQERRLHVILPFSPAQHTLALMLGQRLLDANLCTETIFDTVSIKRMFEKADGMGARFVLSLGEDEQKNHSVKIKDMLKGTQEEIKQTEAVAYLKAVV
jgi:histidyl-tRNA synthetase